MNMRNSPEIIPKPRRWACHKLECFADYLDAYTGVPNDTGTYYLELYAGGGRCICHGTDCGIDDSSLRALKGRFDRYIFVVKDDGEAESLERLVAPRGENTEIITGNCNNAGVIRCLLDRIPRSASSFAFIDPPGYRRLRWRTIERLAVHGVDWKGNKMDLLIVFPLEMALLRNLLRPDCQASISRLYGNHEWQAIRQRLLEGKTGPGEGRQDLIELFKIGLKKLGYKYVADLKPAAFSRQPFYYLIWASDSHRGVGILKEVWDRPRYLPCELMYRRETANA
ncbi:three-Cys-motif partner protein TcmP [Chloroflexota bacterium]